MCGCHAAEGSGGPVAQRGVAGAEAKMCDGDVHVAEAMIRGQRSGWGIGRGEPLGWGGAGGTLDNGRIVASWQPRVGRGTWPLADSKLTHNKQNVVSFG